jgi:DNA-directed RNA polymerase omega subunit
MDDTNGLIEQESAPLMPAEPAPPIQSRFLFVDVAALRAKQLRRGARLRFDAEQLAVTPHKPERMAMEEVRRGLVNYQVPKTHPAPAEGQA